MSVTWQVRHSGIWQLTSAVLTNGKESVIIDPGYFPRELAELQAMISADASFCRVVFTHGHWDHVVGWQSFAQSQVLLNVRLRDAIVGQTQLAHKNLRDAQDFDRKWYIDRGAPLRWPPSAQLCGLRHGDSFSIGTESVSVLQLPGHSEDGLALHLASSGLLIVGDYLSPCEIPFVEDLAAYRQTLHILRDFVQSVETVLPGHGPPLSAQQARVIIEQDLRYLDDLADCAERQDVASALRIVLPRAQDVPEMVSHHQDNCRAAGLRSESESQPGNLTVFPKQV